MNKIKSELQLIMEKEQIKSLRSESTFTDKEEDFLQRKKEWHEMVKEQEHICSNETYSKQEKNALEEELTRLVLVITKNKFMLQDMLTQMQETEYELRLDLTLIRADLERSNNAQLTQEEIINWNVVEHRIRTSLTKLEQWQRSQCLQLASKEDSEQERIQEKEEMQSNEEKMPEILPQVRELINLLQRSLAKEQRAERPPLKCYYYHEEGHFKRECPRRSNRARRVSIPRFRRQKQNFDVMTVGESTAWPRNDDDGDKFYEKKRAMTTEQSRRENEKINHNPLSC